MKKAIAIKLCAILLVIGLLFSSIPMAVFAQETSATDTTVIEETENGEGENTEQDGTTEGDEIMGDTGGELPPDDNFDNTEGDDEDNKDGEDTGGDNGDNEGDVTDPEDIENRKEIDISSSEELEIALTSGYNYIRIISDFFVDRTFYITYDTTIYTEESHTITRAADFAGDIFVVGEDRNGEFTEEPATLKLGKKASKEQNLLVIDGNKDNLTCEVSGTVVFVCPNATANLYENVTITNNRKSTNERTLTKKYGVSYTVRVGGAAAILSDDANMNIYGGNYTNNIANDMTSADDAGMVSAQGGAIYNYGTLNVYGGLFEGNHAARGGVFYNYRRLHIYNAQIKNNTSSETGAVMYVPNSGSAFTYIGEENEVTESEVVFEGNTAGGYAGAIYVSNHLSIENASFVNNSATKSGGAIYASGVENFFIENSSFTENESKVSGGAICAKSSTVYMYNVKFNENIATENGGAVYSETSQLEIDKAEFNVNSATASGGAIALFETSTVTLNDISADGNITKKNGGFIYSTATELNIYSSTINNNSADNGGALYLYYDTVGGIYETEFVGNKTTTNGGALFVYTNGTKVTLFRCSIRETECGGNGTVYASKVSLLDMFDCELTDNSAQKAGCFYITTTGTTVNLVDLTIKGNTVTGDAPIIWGNSTGAVLNVDKASFTDLDATGELDDAYWTAAIVNELKVYDKRITVPSYKNYDARIEGEITNEVKNAHELELALQAGFASIKIIADFEIDRTLYITKDVMIYSDEAHTLTRAYHFGGDVFVIGEDSEGTVCETPVCLTLGLRNDDKKDMLIIDGNADNMLSDVSGTVVFVCPNNKANIFANITIQNNAKILNERTLNEKYALTSTQIGGAAAIVISGYLNVYGATFKDNIAKVSSASYDGGAIYACDNTENEEKIFLYIKDAEFIGNQAGRGGAIYCISCHLEINKATFKNNTSSSYGGAVALYETATAKINEAVAENNKAGNYGGFVYASASTASIYNTVATGNSSTGGGAVAANADASANVYKSEFIENKSSGNGGALFFYTGGQFGNVFDCTFTKNTASKYGGAIFISSNSDVDMYDITATGNTGSHGGFMYLTAAGSVVNLAGLTVSENTATTGGPIIWGNTLNADLYIDKAKYTDLGYEGELDDAYWETAIVNKLTVVEKTLTKPEYDDYDQPDYDTDVSRIVKTPKQLERALNAGYESIKIAANFRLDRTYYITKNVNIYSDEAHTLTRAAGFAGDIFVVGEYSDGTPCEEAVTITLGNENSDTANLLTFDGNSKNSTVSVNGSVLFVAENGRAKIYKNLTFVNNKKVQNERILAEKYILNDKTRVAGSVATVYGGSLGVYGAVFKDNTTSTTIVKDDEGNVISEETVSTDGGVIYVGGVNENVPYQLYVKDAEFTDNSAVRGGAVAVTNGATAYFTATKFTGNDAKVTSNGTGGALFVSNANVEVNGAVFNENTAKYSGNAVSVRDGANAVMNNVTATTNTGGSYGGFVYIIDAHLDLYNSKVNANRATYGAGLYIREGASVNVYATEFVGNSTNKNGGAIFAYTDGGKVVLQECLIKDTVCSGSGTVYASSGSLLDVYNCRFENNTADIGGVMYATTTGTVINFKGITLSGNTATSSAPIIHGNSTGAVLNIDKSSYVDSDATGELDDAYWAAAIVNKLTVNFVDLSVPSYSDFGDSYVEGKISTDVSTAYELERAITAGLDEIRIIADFEIDRTFYITKDVTIYADERHVLTRANHFGSDIFVVGENKAGELCETPVKLTLGKESQENMLVVDGANDNMVCDIVGTVIFVCPNSIANVYSGFSAVNHKKTGNEKVLANAYGMSYPVKIGGSVAIVSEDATLNIYGGTYSNNSVNKVSDDAATSSQGGAFYNFGKLNIYGGVFNSNSAVHGGLFFNYRRLSIYVANINDNTSSSAGGAIYMPNSTGAFLVVDGANKSGENAVIFSENTAGSTGGAIYGNNSINIKNAEFNDNSSTKSGGAIFLAGGKMDIDGVRFEGNTSNAYGGAVAIDGGKSAVMNNITATLNTSVNYGGFLYNEGTQLNVYNSNIYKNHSNGGGGGIALYTGAVTNIYKTNFEENTSDKNAGGLFVYTGEYNTCVHTCTFKNNTANAYGGAIFVSGKSQLQVYDTTATNNIGSHGGFMYETAAGTVVTLGGITVSGNSATTGGPIIWGNTANADMYIDKSTYTDLDYIGEKDDAYWKSAIANKLTVVEQTVETPIYDDYANESAGEMAKSANVTNADELEKALADKEPYIRIIADFEIDRTYYINYNPVIFTTIKHTITRASHFGGEMFVIGLDENWKSTLIKNSNSQLTLGNPISTTNDLLIIDGNKENMQVEVTGSVIYLDSGAIVNLYDNVTVMNSHKTGNVLALREDTNLPTAKNRVGATLATVEDGTLNVYGGIYKDNSVREEDTSSEEGKNSSYGGLIYNYSNVRIYGGNFIRNTAGRGGVIYNYRVAKIYGGVFSENYATNTGGAIYSPTSASCHLIIGSEEEGSPEITFLNNTAAGSAGAIYTGTMSACVIYGNASFAGNTAIKGSGGAIVAYGQLTARNVKFSGNKAYSRGGVAFISKSGDSHTTRIANFVGCTFENNNAGSGGALGLYAASYNYSEGGKATVTNCEFIGNSATKQSETASSAYGGAIACERKAQVTVKDTNFSGNSCELEGGALYIVSKGVVDVENSTFTENTNTTKNGGAVSLHSATLNAKNTVFEKNSTVGSAGAIYVSYSSSSDVNSTVNLTGCSFAENTAKNAGAIYVTRHAVENEHRILTVKDTEFKANSSTKYGGALFLTGGSESYLKNTKFTENIITYSSSASGAAIYATSNSVLKMDGGEFKNNSSRYVGGAISALSNAKVTLNNITADGNTCSNMGGFAYVSEAMIDIYNSNIKNNASKNSGAGAIVFYTSATGNVYNTVFEGNKAAKNGAAILVYTSGTLVTTHDCSFVNNIGGTTGGAVYASKASVLDMYNTTATGNSSQLGGFMYATTTATTVTLNGLTVSGNTATEAGPIIYGNSNWANLRINKSNYVDSDYSGEYDDAYWNNAIVNELKVEDINDTIPGYSDYVPETEETITTSTPKTPVELSKIFALEKNASDANLDKYYNKFEKLDSSSNFMSKNVSKFENINGKTVTVDTFVYGMNETANNCNVGQGLLIYQAMLYKQAHPEEEVYIDAASYRFSVQAAVNIHRGGRYFGYMRNLSGAEYDKYGFVRIAYLLVSAARMGIHVTVLGHIDGYPTTKGEPDLVEYFTQYLGSPCDSSYVENGVVGDYLDFNKCDWTLGGTGKGGTDMMHTKMCAVSNYLDMNGVEHGGTVFSSSSNLDGIKSTGINGNYTIQTGSIVSDHEEIYQTAANYIRFMTNYTGQEEIYEFQNLMNVRSTEQAKLILEGKYDEIPKEERLVYLGTEQDKVFELYFTPFGGGSVVWDEINNPYCKYLRKMYNSEDYILFTWNTAQYAGNYSLGLEMEDAIISAFHDHPNVNNRIYGNMKSFDASTFDDLIVGEDIGAKSFNQKDFGNLHNKDMQVSYVENGQRYYVTMLNSMNIHSGSMCYQSNFMLVVKETECKEDGVFFTLADLTTKNIVEHNYGEIQTEFPEENEHGHKYQVCLDCGKRIEFGTIHRESDWIVDRVATETLKGIEHIECTVCGNLLKTREVSVSGETIVDLSSVVGTRFSADASTLIAANLNAVPHTFEAMVQIPKSMSERAGVIMGNYGLACDTRLNIEAYTYGRIRLYFIANGNKVDHIFNTDIRSDSLTHIAVTVDGNIAKLYVNGELAETATIEYTYSAIPQNFKVGGDNRTGNSQYFKGKLYSANVFSDVRTENEIKRDCILVDENADSLLFGKYFKKQEEKVETKLLTTKGKTFNSATLFEMPSIQKGIATIEATVVGNEGVIVGNYSENASNYMNLELVEGNVKISYATDGNSVEHIFSPEVPANEPTHIAVTMDTSASLYINGVLMETVTLEADAPSMLETMKLGGDNRSGNTAYFKGSIFSAALFSEIRSSEEIYADMLAVPSESDEVIYSGSFVKSDAEVNISAQNGQIFSEDMSVSVEKLEKAPVIFDATVKIPTDFDERAGVIIGNYSDSGDQINLEVYTDGRVRLYATKGTRTIKQVFSTDIRSDEQTRVSLVAEGRTATLYVNGEKKETVTLAFTLPDITEGFKIGGDNRTGNAQYFKGTIYSVNLYGDNKAEELLFSKEFKANEAELVLGVTPTGKTFNNTDNFGIGELDNAPVTFEAVVNVPKNISERAGVIVGNYDNSASEQFNLEISQNGTVRAVVITNGKKYYYAFSKDIRSQGPSHIVLTASGEYLTLYVNGVKIESKPLATNFPKITDNFKIGGDNRLGNTQYFKGTIYSVNLFDEVRTAGEIAEDMIAVSEGEEGLLYSGTFTNVSLDSSFNENDGKVFSAGNQISVQTLAETPQTFEAILTVPKDIDDRAGTIIGNYDGGNGAQVNIEAYSGGKIRLFMHNGSFKSKVAFGTDIRSDEPTHIAITVDGKLATLYVNGTKAETVRLLTELPEMRENIKIGGDNRTKGDATFKGKLYAIALFSDIRTDAQIKEDYASVNDNEEGLLYLRSFTEDSCHANLTDTKHIESEWIIDAVQTVTEQGMKHTECELCSKVITVALTDALKEENQTVDYADSGITFEEQEDVVSVDTLKSAPKTFEAVLNLPTSVTSRAGVIIGNYDNSVKDQFNLEIYTNGNPRIYYKAAKKAYSHVFKTDVRSDTVTRLAITIDGLTVKLYLNGVLKETVTLTVAIPSITEGYKIGADNRAENPQFFKGTIYAVNVFEDVRTDEEIKTDAIMVTRDTAGLAYSKYFSVISEEQQKYPYNLEGKVIVNFGDSIFGNYKAPVDISTYISEKTGATVYNVGFGGAQMSETSNEKYDAFGMENLADAITTGDFSLQEKYYTREERFIKPFNTLKSIDFNSVDIITIAYGTNDFVKEKTLDDIRDAVKYSIETISKKYPDIQIVLCTPVYRFWLDDNGDFVEDSNAKEINGIKLTDYIKLYKDIADEYGLLLIDNYNGSGINITNKNECFTGTDTTHPNETGRQMIAENMAKELYKQFGCVGQKYPYNLEGKVIVNFGDSIFGNYKAPVDISTYISEKTGATAYNVGFGSAQMSENSTAKYEPFGMKNLADAITTGDWTTQNAVINSGNAPVAYKRCLPTLQSIDFNNVDIITIAYGTNDFKNGKSLEEVGDALRYSIETISKKYPNIQIVLCTPVYRFWLDDNGNFVEDSTTKEINGIKLTDYIELYKNIADEYNLFVIDNYNYSGINAANRNECFTGTDTTHPNETGRQMIAENMAKELYNYFG